MTDTEAQPVAIAAPPELAERALMIEMATQMALAAGYAPHCWPTWEQEATVIIPTLARLQRERDQAVEALLAVVSATRAYLPPDGISEQECITLILSATDNQTINPLIASIGEPT